MHGNDLELLWNLTPSEQRLLKAIRGIRNDGGLEKAPEMLPEVLSDLARQAANESE